MYENIHFEISDRYGAHTWSSELTGDTVGIGFSVDSVQRAQVPALMQEWHDYFKRVAGEQHVSAIGEYQDDRDWDNQKIFLAIQESVKPSVAPTMRRSH